MAYVNIEEFMRVNLNLTGNELIVYAIIYGFSQDGKSGFTGSLTYLSKWTGLSKSGVQKLVAKLESKKLVSKQKAVTKKGMYYRYIAVALPKSMMIVKDEDIGLEWEDCEKQVMTTGNKVCTTVSDSIPQSTGCFLQETRCVLQSESSFLQETNNIYNKLNNNINNTQVINSSSANASDHGAEKQNIETQAEAEKESDTPSFSNDNTELCQSEETTATTTLPKRERKEKVPPKEKKETGKYDSILYDVIKSRYFATAQSINVRPVFSKTFKKTVDERFEMICNPYEDKDFDYSSHIDEFLTYCDTVFDNAKKDRFVLERGFIFSLIFGPTMFPKLLNANANCVAPAAGHTKQSAADTVVNKMSVSSYYEEV